MKIIKYKKVGNSKYKIYLENSNITLYENVILKHNLLLKKEINEDLLMEINEDNYRASIYDKSLKYIGVRMRSRKEVKEYLLKNKFELNDIEDVINKLEFQGILNDNSFCQCYINDKINLTNNGLDKIKNDLIKLGIEESIINEKLCNIDKSLLDEKLKKMINKELRINSKLPICKLKNKIVNRCINMGYKLNDINNILENIEIKSNSNITNDYNKLYKKYSSKYGEYKLKNVIKSKLYQMGYEIDEINKIVN